MFILGVKLLTKGEGEIEGEEKERGTQKPVRERGAQKPVNIKNEDSRGRGK